MIKRCIVTFILMAVLAASLTIVVYADVIVEVEHEYDFYNKNASDCVSLGRHFLVNGNDGYVYLKSDPGSKNYFEAVKNGEILYIQCTYNQDGEIWGYARFFQTYRWIPMEDMLLVYDYISFAEEYGKEFYTYAGSYDAVFEADDIALWEWPGSGIVSRMLEPKVYGSFSPENVIRYLDGSSAYKDGQGREWIFMSSKYATGWICISDLANTELPAFAPPPEPVIWKPYEGGEFLASRKSDSEFIKQQNSGSRLPVILIILIAALSVITAILVAVFKKKKASS